jgi:hypothetical protein
MQVARDRGGEAGEANVNTNDGRFTRIKVCDFDDPDQVISPVGRKGRTERGACGLERLAHQCRCLSPVQPDIPVLAALLRVERRRYSAYANV